MQGWMPCLWRQLPPKMGSFRKGGAGKWKLYLQTKLSFDYLWVANSPFGTSASCSLLNGWETNLFPTGYSKFLHTNLKNLNGYFILLLLIENAFDSSFSCSSFSIIQPQPLFIKRCVPTPRHIMTEKGYCYYSSTKTASTPLCHDLSLSSIYSFLKVIMSFKIIACFQNAFLVWKAKIPK